MYTYIRVNVYVCIIAFYYIILQKDFFLIIFKPFEASIPSSSASVIVIFKSLLSR